MRVWAQPDELAARLGPRYGPPVLFAAATGLRPGEWMTLEQRDIDRQAGVVYVRRALRNGRLKSTKMRGVSARSRCRPSRLRRSTGSAPTVKVSSFSGPSAANGIVTMFSEDEPGYYHPAEAGGLRIGKRRRGGGT